MAKVSLFCQYPIVPFQPGVMPCRIKPFVACSASHLFVKTVFFLVSSQGLRRCPLVMRPLEGSSTSLSSPSFPITSLSAPNFCLIALQPRGPCSIPNPASSSSSTSMGLVAPDALGQTGTNHCRGLGSALEAASQKRSLIENLSRCCHRN